jgi:predicted dehydrogenase
LGRARLVGVCDVEPGRAAAVASRFSVPRAGADLHRMIDDLRPDAVVMAGPPDMHVDGGLHALGAGCHLFTEKPPASSSDGLRKLAAAAAESGVAGMVGHNLRFTAAWRRMEERLADSEVTSVAVTYHASGPTGPRWGKPALQAFLLTHAVHVFDLFNATLGPPMATNHHVLDAGNGRYVTTSSWAARTGILGTAVISTCAPRFDWSVRVSTRDGTLAHISSPDLLEVQAPRAVDPWSYGRRDVWRARTLDAGYDTAGYGAELAHFLDCVTGTATPTPSFTDELAVYQALDDLYVQTERHPHRARA